MKTKLNKLNNNKNMTEFTIKLKHPPNASFKSRQIDNYLWFKIEWPNGELAYKNH